jgi:hypothetical protein
MTPRTAGPKRSALILVLGAVVVTGSVAAAIALGRDGSTGSVSPSIAPSAVPEVTPAPVTTPVPTVEPTPPMPTNEPSVEPSVPPVDAMPLTVDLETLTPHHVYIDIADQSGRLVSAVSGTPTASAPVDMYVLKVENIDARTLRLTWVDRPGDNALALYINEDASRFLMVQPEHDTDGDAIVHDRVLILTFRDPISAGDVEPFLQEGLDTPG